MIVLDSSKDRAGDRRPRRLIGLSHPIWRAGPFRIIPPPSGNNDFIEIFPADYFTDGTMWTLVEYRGMEPIDEIDQAVDLFEQFWKDGREP